jgi:hypothetical protein
MITIECKEPRGDTQCANPIPLTHAAVDLVALAIHVVGNDVERTELLSSATSCGSQLQKTAR